MEHTEAIGENRRPGATFKTMRSEIKKPCRSYSRGTILFLGEPDGVLQPVGAILTATFHTTHEIVDGNPQWGETRSSRGSARLKVSFKMVLSIAASWLSCVSASSQQEVQPSSLTLQQAGSVPLEKT